jgi:hypothetical protein
MKRTVFIGAVVLMAAICAAQVTPAARKDFGRDCNIEDTSNRSALEFARSDEGEWSVHVGGAGSIGGGVARVWRGANWMVEMHGALGPGMSTMHAAQMCFDPQGRITYMIDRYVDANACGCMRITSVLFADDGRVKRRDQKFVVMATGAEIGAPEAAKGFPEEWDFRKLQDLPFYPLLKK